jgi:hypothetical protein
LFPDRWVETKEALNKLPREEDPKIEESSTFEKPLAIERSPNKASSSDVPLRPRKRVFIGDSIVKFGKALTF